MCAILYIGAFFAYIYIYIVSIFYAHLCVCMCVCVFICVCVCVCVCVYTSCNNQAFVGCIPIPGAAVHLKLKLYKLVSHLI